MNSPKTLLEIAGAPVRALEWRRAALIMIDFQNEYTDGVLKLGPESRLAIETASRVISYARRVGTPVFHVVHHGASGSAAFDPQTPKVGLIPALSAIREEPIIVKNLPNAFNNTNLHELIRLSGRQQLIFCGFMSHMCVNASVRAALDLGYTSFVISDACATRDLADERGEIVPAEVMHRASMAALRDRFATVCLADTVLVS